MGLMSFFQNRRDVSNYRKIRDARFRINNTLVERVPKAALLECAKKLGLRKGKTLVLDNEHEVSVLLDYCLYSHRQRGKTIIQSYLEQETSWESPEEMVLLSAMAKAHYSVFIVESVEKGKGVTLFDILRSRSFFLMDIGIGTTAAPRMFFAGRVLPVDDYFITSGAFIPLKPDLFERRVLPALERFCGNAHADSEVVFSPAQEAAFSGEIIRGALKEGALDNVAYE